MGLDFERLVFPGRHQPIFAPRGMVATSQPLATQAGVEMLRRGGNAVDAAVATAAALTVVEPSTNGIGGDAFALVWDGTQLHGLNGSGRAPARLTVDEVHLRGHETMPGSGWLAVTVPGAPAAWHDLHARFGRLPFAQLFEPAIAYAEQGYPVSPICVWHWRWAAEQVYPKLSGVEFSGWAPAFAPNGRPPRVGETWRCPDLAASLRAIADSGAEALYRGALAERIVAFAAATGGTLAPDDLARHTSEWSAPIATSYRGYDVWEMPPSTQGIAVLIALNILEGFDLGGIPPESGDSTHLQLEAMKLAFADVERYVADPQHADVPVGGMLAKDYAARRRALISEAALLPAAGEPPRSDTAYLCTADGDGMMVSLIQSTGDAFGSFVVVPGTGIALQNRADGFSLDPAHPNLLAPGKRPFHTLIPGFLTHEGRAVGPFGVMGGHMQPQGHVQMVVNTLDYAMEPQSSLDAPRWSWWGERFVKLEPGLASVADELRRRGHEIDMDAEVDWAGRGQIIWRLEGEGSGYVAGSDHRGDGQASGF